MITGFNDFIYGLKCKSNGQIVCGCRDGTLKVYDVQRKKFVIDI